MNNILSPQQDESQNAATNSRAKTKYAEIAPETPIKEALRLFKDDSNGIMFVLNDKRILLGILTDGDFRHAMACGLDIDAPCCEIMNKSPLTGKEGISLADAKELLKKNKSAILFYLPIINQDGVLVDVIARNDLTTQSDLPLKAVIMAGGLGSRLGELTRNVPKPLLKIGQDKPLLEHIVCQMKRHNIQDIVISTHHMGEQIHDYFEDGSQWNVNISYVNEDSPLGTAGALSLLEDKTKPLLVMNGDILTSINLDAMWQYHVEHKAALTVACRQYDMPIPYGVIDMNEEGYIEGVREKPSHSVRVNAGIYIVNPEIVEQIPVDKFKNMTDIIKECCDQDHTVSSFIIHEYWLDVGQPKDYKKAQEDYKNVFETK